MSSPRKRKISMEADSDGPAPKHAKGKGKGRLCSVPGCTKQVQQGGVCCRHGAKTTRAACSHEGCTNVAKRGGLCRRHGAFDLKTCAHDGCRRCAKRGKFCDNHAAEDSESEATITTQNSSADVSSLVNGGEACGAAPRLNPDPALVQATDAFRFGCTDQTLDSEAFMEPQSMEHGQLNFLCDYYEDMYEPFPV